MTTTASTQSLGRPGAWLVSLPCLMTVALFFFEPLLPRPEFLAFGKSGFDVFNVWMILSWPFGALALLRLHKSRISIAEMMFLYPVNLGGVFCSACMLLVSAGV